MRRFEWWCRGLFVTFCATYGPISVWGIDNVWPGYLAVAALAWTALMGWMLSTPKRMKAPGHAIATWIEALGDTQVEMGRMMKR